MAAFAFLAGCASPPRSSMDVTMSHDGIISVGEKPVELKRLPAALKAHGATSATGIHFAVPEHFSQRQQKELTQTLVNGGYPRVIFTKPKKAVADTAPGK